MIWRSFSRLTPDGAQVVLPAIIFAKILEEHEAVADLELIDRIVRRPDQRTPDPRPGRERFLRCEGATVALVVIEFGEVPAMSVTVFAAIPEGR